ncbi:MAG: retropepsin-like aspartic protease, partial [Flavobacteriaceae bacterium]
MRSIFSFWLFLFLCLPFCGLAQFYSLPEDQKYEKIRFELVNNLIIVPIEVNGIKLSFILDSGVNKPILFNLADQDSISLNNVSEISIRGLGSGEPIKALVSKGNTFKIENIVNTNQQLYVVLDKEMNFSPRLG